MAELSKEEIQKLIRDWLKEWGKHNLDGVMEIMHDDVIFENWTGAIIKKKKNLKLAWTSWFKNHGNFMFTEEDLFVDEYDQKVLLQWKLEWPSQETGYCGEHEVRRGTDIIHLLNGQIHRKYTYSKTTVLINDKRVTLSAQEPMHDND